MAKLVLAGWRDPLQVATATVHPRRLVMLGHVLHGLVCFEHLLTAVSKARSPCQMWVLVVWWHGRSCYWALLGLHVAEA